MHAAQPTTSKSDLYELLGAVLATPADPRTAAEYYDRLMSYEAWVGDRKADDEYPDGLLPHWHEQVLLRWPAAFLFYRQRAFEYVSRVLGIRPWGALIHGLLTRCAERDPAGAAQLRQELEGAHDRYLRQRQHANAVLVTSQRADTARAAMVLALQFYQAVYEIDLPLWLLGVIGRALRTGRIDPGYLGGPETRAQQGSLVERVTEDIADTPLPALFEQCYDRDLRNAVGHNDIEVVDDGERRLTLVDHSSDRRWTEEQAWALVQASHDMYDAILLAVQLFITGEDDEVTPDMGVISMAYTVLDGELPMVLVFQLWCFRDLSPDGRWLRDGQLSIREVETGTESVSLTTNATVSGEEMTSTPFGRALAEHGWAHVLRVPVAPQVGIGLPTVQIVTGETLEVVGPADEFFVPVELASPWPRSQEHPRLPATAARLWLD